MRKLSLLVPAALAAAMVVGTAGAAQPKVGTLSVEQGKGQVIVEIRGNVLGRLGNGTLRIVDQTPRDRFVPIVAGRRLTVTKLGAKTTLYKGQALRFRMLGGSSKITVKGSGISVSAVGRGTVTLDGDRRQLEDNAGVYSLDGLDCSQDAPLCTPLPDLPERHVIGPRPAGSDSRSTPR